MTEKSGESAAVVVRDSGCQSGLSLLDLWSAFTAWKKSVLTITAICCLLGVVYALLATPIYRASVVLMPIVEKNSSSLSRLGSLASLAGINLGTGADGVRSLALLRSKQLVREFISRQNLLPVIFADAWDQENAQWKPDQEPDLREAIEFFQEGVLQITEDRQTGLVTLSIEWTDAEVAAKWAMDIVALANEMARGTDLEEGRRKLQYLSAEMERVSLTEARQAIARVMEEQINALMLAEGQVDYAFRVVDPAIPPLKRARPKRTLIVVMATGMGLFLGLMFAFVQHGRTMHARAQ